MNSIHLQNEISQIVHNLLEPNSDVNIMDLQDEFDGTIVQSDVSPNMFSQNNDLDNAIQFDVSNNKELHLLPKLDMDVEHSQEYARLDEPLEVSNYRNGKTHSKIKSQSSIKDDGYTLVVNPYQRKYGHPPPNWVGPQPFYDCEIFIGNLPRDILEDSLIPLFKIHGTIWDLRLKRDPNSSKNKGYAFLTYAKRQQALSAVANLHNHEITTGMRLTVTLSNPNVKLFVGNIPKDKGRKELFATFFKLVNNLTEVIVKRVKEKGDKNRGFCYLKFNLVRDAKYAFNKLRSMRRTIFDRTIEIRWPRAQNNVLYVTKYPPETTEESLRCLFEPCGVIKRLKRMSKHAFIHFKKSKDAYQALKMVRGKNKANCLNMRIAFSHVGHNRKKKEYPKYRNQNHKSNMINVLYVTKYPPETTEESLRCLFEPCGEIKRLKRMNKYAFIHFKKSKSAYQALKMVRDKNNANCLSMRIACSHAEHNRKKKEYPKNRNQNHKSIMINLNQNNNGSCNSEDTRNKIEISFMAKFQEQMHNNAKRKFEGDHANDGPSHKRMAFDIVYQ